MHSSTRSGMVFADVICAIAIIHINGELCRSGFLDSRDNIRTSRMLKLSVSQVCNEPIAYGLYSHTIYVIN